MLEFDTGICCGELAIGLGMVGISIILPSCDVVDEGLFGGEDVAAFVARPVARLVRFVDGIAAAVDGVAGGGDLVRFGVHVGSIPSSVLSIVRYRLKPSSASI